MLRPNLAEIAAEYKRVTDWAGSGHYGAEITVRFSTGSVTFDVCPDIVVASSPTRLSEGEQEIIDAFEDLESGTVLQVPDIAKRAGCDLGSNLRERLGRLVRLKYLENHRPGYSIRTS